MEHVKPYNPAITAKKALGELALTGGAVVLAALAGVFGEWLVGGGAALLLPPRYLILAPLLAAAGRALLNYAKNKARDVEQRP